MKRSARISVVQAVLVLQVLPLLASQPPTSQATSSSGSEAKLAKLVRIFSKPGAFSQNNTDEIISLAGVSVPVRVPQEVAAECSEGAQGLDCRRAEARRSVDCPRGDCYCYDCSRAGPELWAGCCRENFKCCGYLAAACRTCDQPQLHSFCAKHFKKCLAYLGDKKAAPNRLGAVA